MKWYFDVAFGNVSYGKNYDFIEEPDSSFFRATLEETIHADLLLHVVDASSPQKDEQVHEVNKVLADIGADQVPTILVYNKIDSAGLTPRLERDENGRIVRVFVSALERAGLDDLRTAIVESGQTLESNTFHDENL